MGSKYDDLGFVSIDDICDVFVEGLRKLEDDVLPGCGTIERRQDRAMIVDWATALRIHLITRARSNLKVYLTQNPSIKAAERQEKAAEGEKVTREAYEARIKKGRLYTREGG